MQISDTDVNIEETKASRVVSENNLRPYEEFMESQSEVNSTENAELIKMTEKTQGWVRRHNPALRKVASGAGS